MRPAAGALLLALCACAGAPRAKTVWVDLEIRVGTDGSVKDARVIRSSEGASTASRTGPGTSTFEEYALAAAKRGRFRPKVVNGEPVESTGIYTVTFTQDLDKPGAERPVSESLEPRNSE